MVYSTVGEGQDVYKMPVSVAAWASGCGGKDASDYDFDTRGLYGDVVVCRG